MSTEAAAALMWMLVRSLGPPSVPVHLVGLSFGGMVAQKMAAQRPSEVGSLVLMNTYLGLRQGSRPFPFWIGGLLWLTLCALTLCRLDKASSDLNEAWLLWGPPAWRMPVEAWDRAAEMLAKASSPKSQLSVWVSAAEWLRRRLGDVSFVVAVLRHSLSEREVWQLRSVRRCVVVASGCDWLVKPDNGRRLAELLACALVEFPRHGHLLQLEAPDELNMRLAQWCTEPQQVEQ